MKNRILSLIVLAALILSVILMGTSCNNQKKDDTKSTDSDFSTDTAELELPTHLSPESSETESESEAVPSETETEGNNNENEETAKGTLRFVSYGNGTCAVSGIGSCTDSCVVIPERSPEGDVVTTIESKAFYGNSDIRAIEIPSTVTSIEEMAFGDCPSLVYIAVDPANKAFTDVNGVLFSSDLSRIISYPAASGSVSIRIPSTVKNIEAMAFYGCDTLETIIFDGTLNDWGKISIGDMNYGLFTAALTYRASDK